MWLLPDLLAQGTAATDRPAKQRPHAVNSRLHATKLWRMGCLMFGRSAISQHVPGRMLLVVAAARKASRPDLPMLSAPRRAVGGADLQLQRQLLANLAWFERQTYVLNDGSCAAWGPALAQPVSQNMDLVYRMLPTGLVL